MADTLLSGPAGAGKTAEARRLLEAYPGPAVALDFQSIYAAVLLLERMEDGRYPHREPQHQFAYPLVEYLRRAALTAAADREIEVVLTNSDSSPERRATLLGLLKPGAREVVIDPGRAVVVERLSDADGVLSDQCADAIGRWFK